MFTALNMCNYKADSDQFIIRQIDVSKYFFKAIWWGASILHISLVIIKIHKRIHSVCMSIDNIK